ncbi:efflux RND transporter periplasmic adaptor subunit [Reinekea marinisedimentorum]|uniref:Multidrug efflux system membrane fusion protein n=1 Tax=Reinekea marinisedimentorum TaxID=230495 RepID=A0A4R3IAC3_9GAMM|nr:efflux RND transporter periplasmic adaptor subunit [Reinekea marinisedimentorum]TCS42447.1 multidrug efflux system membrane fusion protein [Reinekea marinisedimentorum]
MSKSRFAGPLIAVIITIAFAAWMMSGHEETTPEQIPQQPKAKSLIPTVQAVDSIAREVQQQLTINGTTRALRNITVISEGAGKVVAVLKSQGDTVTQGGIIARLDTKNIPAQINQAEAFENQANLEYEAALELKRKGLINETQISALYAALQQAKATLSSLQIQLENTVIRSPITGQIENSDLEVGSYIGVGDTVAEVYDYSQLVFEGSVSEKDILKLKLNQRGTVELINGDKVPGVVSYIGSVANPVTRTFVIEMKIAAVSKKISGVTSVAKVTLENSTGHYISPALLYINEDGLMGLKTLDAENRVQFYEVDIIRSGTDGVWVQGLPQKSRIIVVGQGFVNLNDETAPTLVDFDQSKAVGL